MKYLSLLLLGALTIACTPDDAEQQESAPLNIAVLPNAAQQTKQDIKEEKQLDDGIEFSNDEQEFHDEDNHMKKTSEHYRQEEKNGNSTRTTEYHKETVEMHSKKSYTVKKSF